MPCSVHAVRLVQVKSGECRGWLLHLRQPGHEPGRSPQCAMVYVPACRRGDAAKMKGCKDRALSDPLPPRCPPSRSMFKHAAAGLARFFSRVLHARVQSPPQCPLLLNNTTPSAGAAPAGSRNGGSPCRTCTCDPLGAESPTVAHEFDSRDPRNPNPLDFSFLVIGATQGSFKLWTSDCEKRTGLLYDRFHGKCPTLQKS